MFVYITNKRASKIFMSFLSKYKLKSGSFLHEQEKLASYGCLRAQDILLMLNTERWSSISMQTGGTVFPGGSDGKNLPAMKETWVQSLCGENLLEGNGNPLQYSCLENSMHRGDWWATVHGVSKSRT